MTALSPAEEIEGYHALLRHDLAGFAEVTLQFTAPAAYDNYRHNWHIEAMAHALRRVQRGEVRRLMILAPPRSLKSHLASVAFPAWLLGHDPTKRILCASHSLDLSLRLARDFRQVVQSPLYRELFPRFRTATDRDALAEIVTTRRGFRFATSVAGPAVGRGGDIWILDDLHKPDEIYSDEQRERPMRWYGDTAVTRLDDKATGAIVLVMQRLHPEDIAGRLMATGDWEVLCLPAIADQDQAFAIGEATTHHFRAGQYLQPAREAGEELQRQRREMGPINFAAQYLQAPQQLTGGLVQREWLQWYDPPFQVEAGDRVIQSWDVAIADHAAADYSVCTTWAQRGETVYLLDVLRLQQSLPELVRTAARQAERWRIDGLLVEANGVGLALYQSLREEIRRRTRDARPHRRQDVFSTREARGAQWTFDDLTLKRWQVASDKVERLVAVTPWIASGRVRFPQQAPWRQAYLNELLGFNQNARHDDQVDSTTQALAWLRQLMRPATIHVSAETY